MTSSISKGRKKYLNGAEKGEKKKEGRLRLLMETKGGKSKSDAIFLLRHPKRNRSFFSLLLLLLLLSIPLLFTKVTVQYGLYCG